MKSRSRSLLEKSLQAVIAAIEIYNKPDFSYREEAFSILAITSWELLLKARILQLGDNDLNLILEHEHRTLADGRKSKRAYRKVNRSGNAVSIGMFKAFDQLVNKHMNPIPVAVRANLEALVEIRDNSIHLVNRDANLGLRVQEFATACLINYVELARKWFDVDFSNYDLHVMPIAFFRNTPVVKAVSLNTQETRLLRYLENRSREPGHNAHDALSVAIEIETVFKRTSGQGTIEVRVSNSPSAQEVRITEETVLERYPWDYDKLTARLQSRYSNFKINAMYHGLRKQLESMTQFCKVRELAPGNPRSSRKKYYSPTIEQEFDKHYNLRSD